MQEHTVFFFFWCCWWFPFVNFIAHLCTEMNFAHLSLTDRMKLRFTLMTTFVYMFTFKRLGSNFVSQIKWRSMWAFVVQRLESQSIVYGENLQQAAGQGDWGSPIHLYTMVKLLPEVHVKCNWHQSQENARRRKFCDKYEGYSNVCSCKHFYYSLWRSWIRITTLRKRIASLELNTPTRMCVRLLLFSYPELPLYFVYVIAWARGQLRINFTRIFKVFPKLPESRSSCLSHKAQNFWGNCIRARCPRDEAFSMPPQMSKQM